MNTQARSTASPRPTYNRLTPLMCARLAAPHTWPGPSVLTTVFGGVYSLAAGFAFDPIMWCVLLLCAVAAQSAVNTLNDWADFKAGTDTRENSDDPTDAVMVYDNPNPRHVLVLGIAYMAVALVAGVSACLWAGTAAPLFIGAVGGLFIVCYSSGKLPISYLPLGEVVSGVVMGALIPLADICIFAAKGLPASPLAPLGVFSWSQWLDVLAALAPFVVGVAMIMATQNGSDIERDAPIGRRTAAVLLGRRRFLIAYRTFFVLWLLMVAHVMFWNFGPGMWAGLVCLVLGIGTMRGVLTSPLTHEVRGPSMGAINKANLFLNGALCLSAMASLMAPMG